MVLERDFYLLPAQAVARGLLGKKLIRQINNQTICGYILETEAYDGERDEACHARNGKTERNKVMYGPGGYAYIYFTYGMHWMLNCVAGESGYPAAVLIRSIKPVMGLDYIRERRHPIPQEHWTNGPAKLTKALDITGELNGVDLCSKSGGLFIEEGVTITDGQVHTTARIGIQYAPEPWKSKKWRFVTEIMNGVEG